MLHMCSPSMWEAEEVEDTEFKANLNQRRKRNNKKDKDGLFLKRKIKDIGSH